ncbi:CPBP family intramembrane glutamic endopeptidase [Clostridium lacusfryxellense]|uniref:CPBP family intramembrane glutamic endopeptidase n=1 Tax=Clostridium lacusfryxellense TaxID=205328 RepID=UPI001C0CF33E|nr:type II CAAX endopeptidase family protein [Clostridium lacusfryxellense]MBU3111613.1 CPBP family intramembrane metalloprotease [Clostridium lacusfryxellense]
MKFLRNLEKETISIKKLSIIKAFFVMVLSVLLEAFGAVPIGIIKLFTSQSPQLAPYINLGAGVVVKYFVIILLLKWYSEKPKEQAHKQNITIKNFICVTLIIIAFRAIFDNSLIYLVNKIPMPDFIVQAFNEMAISPIIMILSAVIIAPIYEEVIFRGIMLKGMARKMNPILAIIISALFFAILHMNIPQGINAFLLGIVIGSIYLNTGSIYLSIFAHFINNSVGITISELYGLISGKYSILFHGVAIILGIIILIAACRWHKQSKTVNELDIYKEFKEV